MSTATLHTGTQKLQEVAEIFRRRGYQVRVEPSLQEIPAFLNGYRPDLIAEGPNDSIIVEVKASGRVHPDDWRTLAETVSNQPGWHFEIVASPLAERHLANLSSDEVRQKLAASANLATQGAPDAALVLTWAAAEAAIRIVSARYKLDLRDDMPGTLITSLYTEGLIERKDYDLLTNSLTQRNAVAHGYRRKVMPNDIKRLREAVERIIAE